MEGQNSETQAVDSTHNVHRSVHVILAHSYLFYFILFVIGVVLDVVFRIKIYNNSLTILSGVILLILGSGLILWAQKTSKKLPSENLTKESFCRGPYCYTRSPTHWGLFLLTLGFGVMANAFFIVISTIIAFVITKFIFIREEESALEEKYGTPYLEYKKKVKL